LNNLSENDKVKLLAEIRDDVISDAYSKENITNYITFRKETLKL
jgi:hypothetical protein